MRLGFMNMAHGNATDPGFFALTSTNSVSQQFSNLTSGIEPLSNDLGSISFYTAILLGPLSVTKPVCELLGSSALGVWVERDKTGQMGNNNFAGIGIVFNVAGCLIRGRRRWSVTYTSPRGLRISNFFIIWNRRAFQERKPYQFPGWMKNSPYYFPGRGANPRPPAHPDFITSKESHTLLVRP